MEFLPCGVVEEEKRINYYVLNYYVLLIIIYILCVINN